VSRHLSIVLGAPGEAELPLLAELCHRDDVTIVAVVDPTGQSLGGAIAEVMGLPVVSAVEDMPVMSGDEVCMVLPKGRGSLTASLARAARAAGLPIIAPTELRARLLRPAAAAPARPDDAPPREPLPGDPLDDALAGLETVLAGETLLHRLLDAGAGALGASGASLMLRDEASGELYIACATGLSERTLHGTRLRAGEGIAGRVARSGRAELITGVAGVEGRHRDRPEIASALCAPLVDDHADVIGVINLSRTAGDQPFTGADRDRAIALGTRLGRAVGGVRDIQRQRASRRLEGAEHRLRDIARQADDMAALGEVWVGELRRLTEASRCALAVPCDDGSLLICEDAAGEEPRHWHESLHNPAWIEVLGSGAPLVVRQDDDAAASPLTVFFLPVAAGATRAGVSLHFERAAAGHAFQADAGGLVMLLDRLLPVEIERATLTRRTAAYRRLAEVLADLAAHDGTLGAYGNKIATAAAELAGARHVAVIAELGDHAIRLGGGNVPEDAAWLADAGRLLTAAAGDGGWRVTTLESEGRPVSVLAAVATPPDPAPGLLLVGKTRAHPLDGHAFTTLDAEVLLPLIGLLSRLRPDPDAIIPAPVPVSSMTAPATPAEPPPPAAPGHTAMLADLGREMDRCDRYHNACGLLLLRPSLPADRVTPVLEDVSRVILADVRSSDRLYRLSGDTVAVLVPEDVRHLDRLQERLVETFREHAGDPDLPVAAARGAYPADQGPAADFLQRLLARLR
jgi:hypothetical protein